MYSFDVYDTLITRTVIEPFGIFRLMSVETEVPEGFFNVRIASEKKARILKNGEINIEEIYTEIASFYGIDEEQRDVLKEFEIQLEIKNALPVIPNIKKVEELIRRGEKVVLISDMYLPSEVYKKIFSNVAPILSELPLFISCECGAVKSDGSLYEYVAEREKIDYSDWTHIGDNNISDVVVPEMLGIKSEIYLSPGKKVWEEKMLASVHETSEVQLVIGLSKSARIKYESNHSDLFSGADTNLYEYELSLNHGINNKILSFSAGYSFSGPILYAYVSWILKLAQKRGIKRLYFLSRDGYILKEVADIIIKEDDIPVSTYYMFSSRKAWSAEFDEDRRLLKKYILQEIPDIEKKDFAFVDAKGTGRTIDRVAQLFEQKFEVFFYTLLEPVGQKRIYAHSFTPFGGLIEAICRAPHGITLSYKEEVGRIQPVIGEDSNGDMEEYIYAVKSFTEDFNITCKKNELTPCLFSVAEWLMQYAVNRPDRELAAFIGDIIHNENNDGQRYAPEMTVEEIRNAEYVRTTEPVEKYYKGFNIDYSFYRLDEDKKAYLMKCRKEYYQREDTEKNPSAKRIIIYGFGVCGREVFHRLHCNRDFIVQGIVDQNYQKFDAEIPEVKHPVKIKELIYDYVIISLKEKKTVKKVKDLLSRMGVSREKLIGWKEFEQQYL